MGNKRKRANLIKHMLLTMVVCSLFAAGCNIPKTKEIQRGNGADFGIDYESALTALEELRPGENGALIAKQRHCKPGTDEL